MAEKRGRKRPLHPLRLEEMRQKVSATKLITRLENHALAEQSDPDIENKEMTDSQVRAALGLLKKVLPDLSNMEITGNEEKPLHTVTRVERVIIDDAKN